MKPDGWLRRIAGISIGRPLVAAGMTRRPVTTIRLLLGIVAGGALALGPEWFHVAAAFFLAGLLLERADWSLALASEGDSAQGDRYAWVSEAASNALAFIGLGIGLRTGDHGNLAIGMGLLAAAAIVVLPWLVDRLSIIDGERSAEFSGISGLEIDDSLLAFPIALWAGAAETLLLVSATALTAITAALYVSHYSKLSSD